jgi:5-methyltetrahydropteroyltriglutamate--homocysteine methyltransferase
MWIRIAMHKSTDRILTTHVGSLPRSAELSDLLIRDEAGEAIDKALLARKGEEAVRHVVAKQAAAGVDVMNDGEQPRVGFQTYVVQRMKGFGGESNRPPPSDYKNFPAFAKQAAARAPKRSKVRNAAQAVADIVYDDLSAAKEEVRLFKSAIDSLPKKPAETFMTAASPGIIATTLLNAHYDSHEAYVMALAKQIAKEYELIAKDFILQIDAPDLAMERTVLFQDKSEAEFLKIAELHVAAINEAAKNVPAERIRLHCCWGNWEGPHVEDIAMSKILPILYGAKVGALSIEFANPRHQHEYAALKQNKLPDRFMLLPGVIDSTSNFVEHPEVIANRICEAVDAVGDRSRVIASSDCGFGTFAGGELVAEDVVWAKLRSCSEGAAIATRRLWGR